MEQDVTETIYKGFGIGVDAPGGGDINEDDLVDELNILLREEGEEEIQKKLNDLKVPYHHPYLSHENRPLSHILTEDSLIGDEKITVTIEDGEDVDVEISPIPEDENESTLQFTHRQRQSAKSLREITTEQGMNSNAGSSGLVLRHGPGTVSRRAVSE